VDVASQIEDLEATGNGSRGPALVPEMGVSKDKLAESWDAEERWKRELRPEDRVVRDIFVSDDDRNVRAADQIVCVANGARDVV